MARLGIALVTLAVAAGCGDDGGALACEDAEEVLIGQVDARYRESRFCADATECGLASVDAECAIVGSELHTGPRWAVHVDSTVEWQQALQAAAGYVCDRTADGCNVVGDPPPLEARCAGYRCTAVDPASPCMASCQALGCGGCDLWCHLPVTAACAASAGSCEALDACGSTDDGLVVLQVRPFEMAAGCLGDPEPIAPAGPIGGGTGDVVCAVAPDGRAFVFPSGSWAAALGWPFCEEPIATTVLSADPC